MSEINYKIRRYPKTSDTAYTWGAAEDITGSLSLSAGLAMDNKAGTFKFNLQIPTGLSSKLVDYGDKIEIRLNRTGYDPRRQTAYTGSGSIFEFNTDGTNPQTDSNGYTVAIVGLVEKLQYKVSSKNIRVEVTGMDLAKKLFNRNFPAIGYNKDYPPTTGDPTASNIVRAVILDTTYGAEGVINVGSGTVTDTSKLIEYFRSDVYMWDVINDLASDEYTGMGDFAVYVDSDFNLHFEPKSTDSDESPWKTIREDVGTSTEYPIISFDLTYSIKGANGIFRTVGEDPDGNPIFCEGLNVEAAQAYGYQTDYNTLKDFTRAIYQEYDFSGNLADKNRGKACEPTTYPYDDSTGGTCSIDGHNNNAIPADAYKEQAATLGLSPDFADHTAWNQFFNNLIRKKGDDECERIAAKGGTPSFNSISATLRGTLKYSLNKIVTVKSDRLNELFPDLSPTFETGREFRIESIKQNVSSTEWLTVLGLKEDIAA